MATKPQSSVIRTSVLRLTRLHFVFIALLALQTVVQDAWKLITPNTAMNRWILIVLLLIINTAVWYLAHNTVTSPIGLRSLVMLIVLADIAAITYSVYTQRGMASRAVFLYALPITIASLLLSRVALVAVATICAATYFAAAYIYFVVNFNEGYKIELYSEVGFYCAMFYILSALLWIVVRHRRQVSY